jgi:anti-anti-sigma factor
MAAERVADGFAVHPLGPIQRDNSWLNEERLLGLAEQIGAGRLYLDCRRFEFLTSEGIAWLIRLRQRALKGGGRLVLCNLQPPTREVLDICRLLDLFDHHDGDLPGGRPRLIEPVWLAWNDGLIPRLARGVRDRRAFKDMPILGDALEEAGCTNADILTHCREPGEHVRDCWILAALLETEG